MALLSRKKKADAARPPVPFIVGVGRSGTTMLRLMLDAHPELTIPPETHFVPDLIDAIEGGATPEQAVEVMTAVRQWGDLHTEPEEVLGGDSSTSSPPGRRSGRSTRCTPSARASRATARRRPPT